MQYVTFEIKERIGFITLNRPEKRNALNAAIISELKEAFSKAENEEAVKVIVLKANGKVFCAGADLEYITSLKKNTFQENLADSSHLMELFKQIYECPKVIIAQVQGHAIAGGCGLATVCDFVFSVPDALFGYTEVNIGFIPAIVSVFLIRKIGEGKAKELLLTGRLINALEAQNKGLINFIEQQQSIDEKVYIFANDLCNNASQQSLAFTKKIISEVQNLDLNSGLKHAAEKNAELRETEDFRKGVHAFLSKEKPVW